MRINQSFMRRRLLLCLAAAGLLSACGQRRPVPKPVVAGGSLPRVALVVGDQSSLIHAKAEAARAMDGLPYQVHWVNFQAPGPLLESLMASDIDLCVVSDMAALAAASAGGRFRVIAAIESPAHGTAILAGKDAPFHKVADLKGHTVTVSSAPGGPAHYLLLGALREAGMTTRDVRIRYMLPGDAAEAFNAGKLEAWATFGLFEASAELRGARVLRDGAGINSGLSLVLASMRAMADPLRQAALEDLLKRLRQANDWTRANPQAYIDVLKSQTGLPEPLTRLLVERAQPREVPLDAHLARRLQTIADTFHRSGVFPKRVQVAALLEK